MTFHQSFSDLLCNPDVKDSFTISYPYQILAFIRELLVKSRIFERVASDVTRFVEK